LTDSFLGAKSGLDLLSWTLSHVSNATILEDDNPTDYGLHFSFGLEGRHNGMTFTTKYAVNAALKFIVICSIAVGAKTTLAQAAPSQPRTLRIYVNHLESSDQSLADMVTAKLISHLVKHGLRVVESEEDADAILTGSGMMQQSTSEYGHTHFRLHAGMRLVSKDKGTVIWADDVSSSKFAESASSSFAENVAKSVEEALSPKPEKQ